MKHKVLALLMSVTMMFGTVSIASATEYTSGGTHTIVATAEVEDSYFVQLPATLVLNQVGKTYEYAGDYTIGCKGVIADTNHVSVVPDANTFTMAGNSGSTANATVTQTVNTFKNSASEANEIQIGIDNFVTTTGHVSVIFSKVDSYSGSVGFTFELAAN